MIQNIYIHELHLRCVEGEWSIHDLLQQWLERTPFLDLGGFSFWKHYKDATHNKFTQDLKYIQYVMLREVYAVKPKLTVD